MCWLQITTCKHALPSFHIANPLAIIQLCIKAFCLFCSLLPCSVPLLACNCPRITAFSVFQFQALPLERGLMNVAHIRVTSEITPPFFPKKIHQAESASPRDMWFSTQGECHIGLRLPDIGEERVRQQRAVLDTVKALKTWSKVYSACLVYVH